MTSAPLIEMRGIEKRFGPVHALRGADFTCQSGSVHALLGENGAGKSTLMGVLFGLHRADAGAIRVQGADAAIRTPRDAIALGIGMVHQHFAQVPRMSVAENAWLGRPGAAFDRAAARAVIERAGADAGLPLDPDALAGDLPVGLRQRLEIIKALSRDVRVLILDEPTAALAPPEADDLFAALDRLRGRGLAIVFITHKLREVAAIADIVTVLRRGAVVLNGPAGTFDRATLEAALIGDGLHRTGSSRATAAVPTASPAPAVSVRGLTVRSSGRGRAEVSDASFEIGAGEIVGIAAVEGNGQRELLRAVAGLTRCVGEVRLAGGAAAGFIPEDRQREGLALDLPMADNLALGGSHGWIMNRRALESATAGVVQEYGIAGNPREPVCKLSGGNQQKLVLARVLRHKPALLVAENPTRGLDPGATGEIHERLRSAARESGAGILFHSPDLDEVIALADRVAVMFEGRWQEVAPHHASRETIGAMMLGRNE